MAGIIQGLRYVAVFFTLHGLQLFFMFMEPVEAADQQYGCVAVSGAIGWPIPPLTSDTVMGCVSAIQSAVPGPKPCWESQSQIEFQTSEVSPNGYASYYYWLVWNPLPFPPPGTCVSTPVWKTRVVVGGYECSIRLSGETGNPSGYLAEIEPGAVAEGLRAQVICSGESVPASVRLSVRPLENSGGHHHHAQRPQGTLSPSGGVSLPNEPLRFSFAAPAVSGDYVITAACADAVRNCTQDERTVWVGVKGLQSIGSGPWELVGGKAYHPNNHYLTVPAFLVLQQLGLQWRRLYVPFGPVFTVNDASLVRGGLFDCCETYTDRFGVFHNRQIEGWWTPPHSEHRRGTVVDINGIRREDESRFVSEAADLGAIARIHGAGTGRHYHVRLMGVAE